MILLVNDDGIDAPGLRSLYRSLHLTAKQKILAVAPSKQRSGMAHAITINRGLQVQHIYDSHEQFFGFALDGTPTDCLKLALKVLSQEEPQMVISGINDGPNVGRSLFYSGTVGAAMEAAVEGHCAMAVSLDRGPESDWQAAADFACSIAESLRGDTSLRGLVVNLNLPALPSAEWKELKLLPHGLSGFSENYAMRERGDGSFSWHLHGERIELEHEGETDAHALRMGHPTITLLRPSYNTDQHLLEKSLKANHVLS